MSTEQHRMQCEAREVLSWDKARRVEFLEMVERRRGADGCQQLKDEIMRQWKAKQGEK